MFSGVFQRLLYTYLFIFAAVILALSAALTLFFSNYIWEQKERQLLEEAERASLLAERYQDGEIGYSAMQEALQAMGYASNARIVVLSPKSKRREEIIRGALENPEADREMTQIARVLQGETVVSRQQFSEDLRMDIAFVGVPYLEEGALSGAILLFSPLNETRKVLQQVNLVLWAVAGLVMLLASAVIYRASRRIASPVRQLAAYADQLATGREVPDLELAGNDELQHLAGAFNRMKHQLLELERMRRDLVANVSHELRTPLTSIRGYLQGLLDGVIPPDSQEHYIRLAYGETQRLSRLTEELLQLARTERVISLQQVRVDLNQLLKDVIQQLLYQAQAGGISLQLETAGEGQLYLEVDPDCIKQVLLNLLTNSLKYTPHGGTVVLRTAVFPEKVRIQVEDTGRGIPAEDLSRVFERFYRVDKSRSALEGGAGLGLSIVKQLVELHGGIIEITSEEGRGTCFSVFLPR